jgi:hypothetical protein
MHNGHCQQRETDVRLQDQTDNQLQTLIADIYSMHVEYRPKNWREDVAHAKALLEQREASRYNMADIADRSINRFFR